MRRAVYYWKCDCPRPDAERASAFTAAKYADGGIETAVDAACRQVLGAGPTAIAALGCAGDHYAYRVECGGRRWLYRAAADATGDDYMLAEAAAMAAASEAGVPVPRVLHTEAVPGAALRWQLMEFVEGAALRDLRLDEPAIASSLGRLLRRLHAVPVDGFGFIDTAHLRNGGGMRGVHRRYSDYVSCRLADHLAYVDRHGLLPADGAGRVQRVLARYAGLFERRTAVLVHRDPAPWNLIGAPDRIDALIDWDDAVGGDPADDLAILRCLHGRAFTDAVEAAYGAGREAGFEARIRLHTLRNMLWKAQIRHQLGYFRPGAAAFLAAAAGGMGVEAATRAKLAEALALAEELA